MMKKFLLATFFGLLISISFAQIPDGYYDTATGSGYTLKTQLYDIIKDHSAESYDALWADFYDTDRKSNGYVWDTYSDVPGGSPSYDYSFYTDQCGNYSGEGSCYNREHSFPKSWFNDATPMYTDLFHLYPTDGYVNGKRSNYPFGEVGSASWTSTNGSKLGTSNYPGYSGTVFEPIDEYKGDFARTYFYMATRYENIIGGWESNTVYSDAVLDGSSDQVYETWYLNMIVEWHNADPVSQKELDRNDAIFDIQGNRNPFIDHPEYVAQIWGGDGVFISNFTQSPESPTSADAVNVTATITSSGGTIATANLKWGTTTGNYPNTVAMTASKGNYSADIPAQANGTNVYYIIEAQDDNAQSSSSSEYNYTVEDNPSSVIFEEDFETLVVNDPLNINGWSLYNNAGTRSWEGREFESNKYAQMSAYSSGESSIVAWMITPEIDLTNINSVNFTFISKDAYNNGDPVQVLISTDYSGSGDPGSSSWTNLNPTLATGSTSGYAASFTESGSIDLTSYCGNTIYIAYKYVGGDPSLTTTMQIDDILITGVEATTGVPQITGVTNSPLAPTYEENVTVSATITDSDGTITLAEIKWGTESGSYTNSVSMSNSGNVYSGDIPAQSKGTIVYYVIEATDNDAETNRSEENTYTVALNDLPQITNVTNLPLTPTEGDDVVVSATIIDSDGTITLVEIKWGTAKGSFDNTVAMTYTGSDDIYNGTIASQTGGTIVSYVIEATDNDDDPNRSDEYSFSFNTAGNEVPEITNIEFDPANPQSEDVVSVSATITDSDGTISTAVLKWGTTSGYYPNLVSMSNTDDDYTADIPAQENNTHVYFIIYALDEDGGSVQSEEMDYLVEDVNLLPEISNVVFDPENPESSDNVRVSATITDSDGTISSATLKWGTSTGTYPNEINITVSSADTYISDSNIPAQQDGTVVYIVIEAEDNEAGIKTSTEFNYTVTDPVNQEPVISDVLLNPASPTENDNVSISASATDSDGSVETVILKWKRGTAAFTEVGMNLSGGKYYGLIPKQTIGETIYFSIVAEDNEGLQGTYNDEYEVSESNGIDIVENNFQIFPNPASLFVTIKIENYHGEIEIKMYDILGAQVLIKKIDFSSQYNLSLEDLDSGIYFINLDADNVLVTKRIIIKK